MGNVASSCCPARGPIPEDKLPEGYLAAETPPEDAQFGEGLPSYKVGWSEYWEGSWDLFQRIWPAAAANGMEAFETSLFALTIPDITNIFFADSAELAWICFSVPYFTRPLGGLLAGYFSDSWGRRSVVIAGAYSVLATTVVQGLIPSQLGYIGGVVLVFARMLQGLAVGATAAMTVYAAEMCPRHTASKGIALMNFMNLAGGMASTGLFACLDSSISSDRMSAWGWRIPYILVTIPGLWSAIRSHSLPETPDYTDAHDKVEKMGHNIWEYLVVIFTEYPINALLYMGISVGGVAAGYSTKTYLVEWLPTYTGVPEAYTMWILMVQNCMGIVALPFGAYYSDQYGPTKVMLTTYSTALVISIPMYTMILSSNAYFYSLALEATFGVLSMAIVSSQVMGMGLLPTEVRGTTTGLLSNSVSCLFGGLSPAFLTWLSTFSPMSPAYYIASCHIISLFTIAMAYACRERGMKVSYMREKPF